MRQRSVTTGWRVGSQRIPWVGTGKSGVPTFSPKVNRVRWLLEVLELVVGRLVDFDLLHARVAVDVEEAIVTKQISVTSCAPQTFRMASASR